MAARRGRAGGSATAVGPVVGARCAAPGGRRGGRGCRVPLGETLDRLREYLRQGMARPRSYGARASCAWLRCMGPGWPARLAMPSNNGILPRRSICSIGLQENEEAASD